MAEPETYFILRNTDYKPDGLIQLGQLISDPPKPYRRLCPPSQPAPETHTSEKVNWSFDRSEATSGEASIFARFLSVLTASASGHASRDLSQTWKAAALQTWFFELGPDGHSSYVRQSVREPDVQEWLRRNKLSLLKKMYMVTGVKVAMQPGESTSCASKAVGVAVKIGGGDPGMGGGGGVAQAGGEAKFDASRGQTESGTPSQDFVFAYRLRRVYVKFWGPPTLGGDVTRAELFSDGNGSEEEEAVVSGVSKEEDEIELGDIREIEIEDEDFGVDLPDWDVKMHAIDEDGGKKCLVILPVEEVPA
ncbi:hypothetical protein MAPG_02595 [Magnaporthiopsis poae ATCC 64411]|uniref:Uncharacterized protein n=1 Tax=Magnaporthiopsis poae (strain ATCC 64411 / 73-15) TaxID=644358 RepID=A0A0C4DRS9_MAGP6|nr:hypothetical protein MAPG_02595 [Magnaporthiopsis poae ATCC 64411]